MSILDKLTENKDILTYTTVREAQLKLARDNELRRAKPREYNTINRIYEGRMRELRKLKAIATQGTFKAYSKDNWLSIGKANDLIKFTIQPIVECTEPERALKYFDVLYDEERAFRVFDND